MPLLSWIAALSVSQTVCAAHNLYILWTIFSLHLSASLCSAAPLLLPRRQVHALPRFPSNFPSIDPFVSASVLIRLSRISQVLR